MNNDSDNCVLANPGITIGTVRVSIYSPEDRNYVLKVSDQSIEQLTLSTDGNILAVAELSKDITRIKFYASLFCGELPENEENKNEEVKGQEEN